MLEQSRAEITINEIPLELAEAVARYILNEDFYALEFQKQARALGRPIFLQVYSTVTDSGSTHI